MRAAVDGVALVAQSDGLQFGDAGIVRLEGFLRWVSHANRED